MIDASELSLEGIKLLLLLAIIVLAIAVALIGYFMSKRDLAITQATDNLTKAVDQLQIIVNGLQLQYSIRQPLIDEQLKLHRLDIDKNSNRIDAIDKDFSNLKTKHEMIHCKKQEYDT